MCTLYYNIFSTIPFFKYTGNTDIHIRTRILQTRGTSLSSYSQTWRFFTNSQANQIYAGNSHLNNKHFRLWYGIQKLFQNNHGVTQPISNAFFERASNIYIINIISIKTLILECTHRFSMCKTVQNLIAHKDHMKIYKAWLGNICESYVVLLLFNKIKKKHLLSSSYVAK